MRHGLKQISLLNHHPTLSLYSPPSCLYSLTCYIFILNTTLYHCIHHHSIALFYHHLKALYSPTVCISIFTTFILFILYYSPSHYISMFTTTGTWVCLVYEKCYINKVALPCHLIFLQSPSLYLYFHHHSISLNISLYLYKPPLDISIVSIERKNKIKKLKRQVNSFKEPDCNLTNITKVAKQANNKGQLTPWTGSNPHNQEDVKTGSSILGNSQS